jgi:hypothetical protein
MTESIYEPVPTCDIPMPILENGTAPADPWLPRILLQAAGAGKASRKVLYLTTAFAILAVFEGVVLLKTPTPEPIVVYSDAVRWTLMESPK